jgi:hypothetical protein
MNKDETKLAQSIRKTGETGKPFETPLTTNERVLARITEGIYRQPASALRELISNAYDADAKQVVILTDAPRFSAIIVRDDGLGLSPETLIHLLKNIGGSAKRTKEGQELEITAANDATRSPGGRRLIGKLGIGLFAVAQFTRHFLIISKRKGDAFRTIADITLGPLHNEQKLLAYDRGSDPEIETGHASIICEPVGKEDRDSQGTEIKLLELLPRTQTELASQDLWAKLDYEIETEGKHLSPQPLLHIGRTDKSKPGELIMPPSLPWEDDDSPTDRFQKFVQTVRSFADSDKDLVDLESVCDRYLQTLWTLALSAPLPYIDGHPFDMTTADEALFFQLENSTKGQAKQLRLKASESVRKVLDLKSPDVKRGDSFSVEVDGVRLSRPIVFRNQPQTSTAVKSPLLCLGRCREEFKGKHVELSGGPLEFEAYLFWTPKVLPTQHQGVVVRVGNASGAVFDRTFMGYQVSEQTRLRQITAEVFIREGFDGAINLDRESYNFAHPHYQFLVKWLHSALRQFANRHKEIGKDLRSKKKAKEGKQVRAALEKKVAELLESHGIEDVPEVVMLPPDETKRAASLRRSGVLVLNKSAVVPQSTAQRKTDSNAEREATIEKKTIAIAQILDGWQVLKGLSYEEQEQLIRDIVEVALFGNEG